MTKLRGKHTHLKLTLVERHSRFLLLIRLASKDTANVLRALAKAVRTLPKGLSVMPSQTNSLRRPCRTVYRSRQEFQLRMNLTLRVAEDANI